MLLPLLSVGRMNVQYYAEASLLQQGAMVGREIMERSRHQAERAAGKMTYERQGRRYDAHVIVETVNDTYRRYIVEVTDEKGRVFRCVRLERKDTAKWLSAR